MATVFGDNSSGFANEATIIDYINSFRTFNNLNPNMQRFIAFLFRGINLDNASMQAARAPRGTKPDLFITINGIRKYISVKKGSGNSVHQEPLSLFERFLQDNNISNQNIMWLKEFHYGDGSIDGNGGQRVKAEIWIANNPNKVRVLNNAFSNETLLRNIIMRTIFVGNVPNAPTADCIFHGTINNGLWARRDEIIEYLVSHNTMTNSSIHFSHLNYQVWNRNIGRNPSTENRRHTMQLKWQTVSNDLQAIRNYHR